jgi:hypothetical protein
MIFWNIALPLAFMLVGATLLLLARGIDSKPAKARSPLERMVVKAGLGKATRFFWVAIWTFFLILTITFN